MRRGLKALGVRCPKCGADAGRRTFPDEEGTERKLRDLRGAVGGCCRRTFPDEEGTERRSDNSQCPPFASRVAEHSPMRRGLKDSKGPSYAAAHLSRRTFPDEEGTESIGFMLRPLRGRKRRRTFPDE